MMKTVIVTGANSMVGKAVAKEFLENGYRVIAVVRNPETFTGLSGFANLRIVGCSLDNYSNLPDIVNENCDGFLHFAWAGTGGTGSDERQNITVQESNIKNSFSAVFAARELGCKCFVGAGSQAEYGICEGEISEDYPEKPITEYGKAKLAVKRMGLEYGRTVGMTFIWPRIFSSYGVGHSDNTMIMSVLRKMLNNQKVELTACTQMWDYINMKDVASAYMYIWNKQESGLFNIASGDYKPLKGFVLEMAELTHTKSEIEFGKIAVSATGHGFMPKVDKLRSLGWEPKVSFKEGITEIIDDIRH